MGYDRIETFVKNEENPYEYCLDFEYGNSAYEALKIARYFGLTIEDIFIYEEEEKWQRQVDLLQQ